MIGKKKALFLAMAGMAAIAFGAACTNGDDDEAQPANTSDAAGSSTGGSSALTSLSGAQSVTDVLGTPQYAAATSRSLSQAYGSQSEGIFVSGTGRVAVDPDLAILKLGIDVQDESVSAAHARATAAMIAVSNAVEGTGVEDRDIQTQRFNIQPVYRWEEVISRTGKRTNEQVLDGYRVTNSIAVKVRDLDSVSTVIDDATVAGGDDIRINGISFTIEDPTEARIQARIEATQAALAHGQQIADAAGVALGKPISLSESGLSQPQSPFNVRSELAFADSAGAPTPIEAGELEIVVTVSAVFAIP